MRKNKARFQLWLFCLALTFALAPVCVRAQSSAAAAAPNGVAIEDHKLNSSLMARPMPYRVVLPANYAGDKQARFPVIYLLHGLTGHYDNWGDKTKIAEYVAPFNVIIVMPEGENGWYTDSASGPNDRFESYIVRELIPEIDKNFRTRAAREGRIVAGLSMGGYGSLKFGLKYPEMFGLVGSFSGALGAPSWTDKTLGERGKWIADSIMSVYGAEDSPTRRENDIYRIAREMTPEKIKGLPFIYLDCGTEDFLIQNNRDFASLLLEKKIPHEFRQLPGGHTWPYWEKQVQEFFRLSIRFLREQNKTAAAAASAAIPAENNFQKTAAKLTPPPNDAASAGPSCTPCGTLLLENPVPIENLSALLLGGRIGFLSAAPNQYSERAILELFAQQRTRILDGRAKAMLMGRHRLSLQWISWDYFGSATVTERRGTLYLKGRQQGRGRSRADYLTVDGRITSVDTKEFKFDGRITTRVGHINNGQPCERAGEMTFKITGSRRYWRLQEMDNPCDTATDYVDVFFR